MTDNTSPQDRPGEARTRKRQRRQIAFALLAVLIGFAIGAATGIFDQGDGNLFSGDWDKLALPPGAAIALGILLAFGFVGLPLWGFTQIDDFKRELNYIAYTGGCLAALAAYPIWAVLHAGGLAPRVEPFGLWLIAFGTLIACYGVAWLRSL